MTTDGPDAVPKDPTTERALVDLMAQVAGQLLDSLEPDLRSRAQWSPLGSEPVEAERVRWFYTPTDHGGVALRELSAPQQSLAMQLLATGLTRPAYVTACTIMGLENILDELEGWHVDWGRERGRDPGLYWVRVFGDPSEPSWGWRFGGHHLSVNVLVREGHIASVTPSFFGADPATSPALAGVVRPLGGTEDLARTLALSLDAHQRRLATLHPRAISDIVSGNRPQVRPGDRMIHMQDLFRGQFTDPRLSELVDRIDEVAESGSGYTDDDHDRMALRGRAVGVGARDLAPDQRDILRTLLASYTDRAPAHIAEEQRRRYANEAELDTVTFGWAGELEAGRPHYYRLEGVRLLIEYDNTQRDANHAHSVWRDPEGDFGLDPQTTHRARHHRP